MELITPVTLTKTKTPVIVTSSLYIAKIIEGSFNSMVKDVKTCFTEFHEEDLFLTINGKFLRGTTDTVKYAKIEENGQKKLLYSEIYFLSTFVTGKRPKVIYIGAAPGLHLDVLVRMFPHVKFIVFDSEEFKISAKTRAAIEIHDEYFTEEHCATYAEEKNMYFISDIRDRNMNLRVQSTTGKKESGNFVIQDMEDQLSWARKIQPVAAMFKFRIPLPSEIPEGKTYIEYPQGVLFKQPYFKNKGVELRLMSTRKQILGADEKWFIEDIYTRMLYHNIMTRGAIAYKNPFTQLYNSIYPVCRIGSNWDGSAATFIIMKYLRYIGREADRDSVFACFDMIAETLWN